MPQKRINGQARAIVFNVWQFMQEEADRGQKIDIKAAQKRAAFATGTSVSTLRRIIREAKAAEENKRVFRTPGKKRNVKRRVTYIDAATQGVIKRIVHNFHKSEQTLPTIDQLLKKLKEQIDFQGSETSLRRVIKDLGFEWKKKEKDSKKVLIEHTKTRLKRIEYLQAMTGYRVECRPIVFADESYIQDTDSSEGPTKAKGQRVDILLAASEDGILPDTLSVYKVDVKPGDTHEYITYKEFETWVKCSLVPNLPPNSVVVVDNASFHNKQEDEPPSSNAKRSDMEAWLHRKRIPFSETMLKPQLYKLISDNKEKFKVYSLDKLLNENNHTVLRLPPLHLDLNPMEIAWKEIKDYVDGKNKAQVIKLVKEKVKMMTSSDWKDKYCKVKNIEKEYQKSDRVIDRLTDEITMKGNDLGSESEGTIEEDEDEDYGDVSESDPDDSIDQYLQYPLMHSGSPVNKVVQDTNASSSSATQIAVNTQINQIQNRKRLEPFSYTATNSAKKIKITNAASLVVISRVNRPKPQEVGKPKGARIFNSQFQDPVIITKLTRPKTANIEVQKIPLDVQNKYVPTINEGIKLEPNEETFKQEPIDVVDEMESEFMKQKIPIQFEVDIKLESVETQIKQEPEDRD